MLTEREEALIAEGLASIAFKWREKLLPHITEDEPIWLPKIEEDEWPDAACELCQAALDDLGTKEFEHGFFVELGTDGVTVCAPDCDYFYPAGEVAQITH